MGSGTAMRVYGTRDLARDIEARRDQIEAVAASGMDVKKLMQLTLMTIGRDADMRALLAKPEGRASAIECVIKLAHLGLEPTGKAGGAYLVRYGATIQVLPDWRSYRDAAIEDGLALDIFAKPVHDGDAFRIYHDNGREVLEHEYDPFGQRGKRKGWYFCAVLPDETPIYHPVTMDDIDKRRSMGNRGTWSKWGEEMEHKTVIRIGCDRRLGGRKGRRLQEMMTADDAADGIETVAASPVDITPPAGAEPEAPAKTVDLRRRIEQAPAIPAPPTTKTPSAPPLAKTPEAAAPLAETAPRELPAAEAEKTEPARADSRPAWKLPHCPRCFSAESVRRAARASKLGNMECTAHGTRPLRFFRATEEQLARYSEAIGVLSEESYAWLTESLSAAEIGDDIETFSMEAADKAIKTAMEIAEAVGSGEAAEEPPKAEGADSQTDLGI